PYFMCFVRSSNGSENQKVDPSPSRLSNPTSPPCRRTLSAEMYSPRPSPVKSEEVSCTRSKRPNKCFFLSSAMPMPKSCTEIRTSRSVNKQVTYTSLASGEYLIALERKLCTTCSNRERSPQAGIARSHVKLI